MKSRGIIILVAFAIQAAFGCTKETNPSERFEDRELVFTAVMASSQDTRWTTDEAIKVFYGEVSSGKFISDNSGAQAVTSFRGSLKVSESVEDENSIAFWAVYPYEEGSTCDGKSVTLTLPSEQEAVEGTFADKLFPAIACSKGMELVFHNVCGGARFCVSQAGIKRIVISSRDGSSLAGSVRVGLDSEGEPELREILAGEQTVVLRAPEGGFIPGKNYFAAILPGAFSSGLNIGFYKTPLVAAAHCEIDTPITVRPSELSKFDNLDAGLDFPVDLKKESLRVLDIGNSYTDDATHYLPNIVRASGIPSDYSLYKITRGASSYKSWVDCYNDRDTKKYALSKLVGKDIEGLSRANGEIGDGSLFRSVLETGWDLIIIHQRSNYATDYDSWLGTGDAGYLKEYIEILRHANPDATIGFMLIHSYADHYSSNAGGSSLERWKKIAAATKRFIADYGIDFVIPYGTAVENLRASSLNDGSDFSTDGSHLADGIGDYVAGCCYYQALFAPRSGLSVIGNSFTKTDFDETAKGVKNISAANAILAQKAALAACEDMYSINNPDTL